MPEKAPTNFTESHHFNAVLHLDTNTPYAGTADAVILVWSDDQIPNAEQYRKTNYPGKTVDIVVCTDPNVQKEQLGEKAVIYHHPTPRLVIGKRRS